MRYCKFKFSPGCGSDVCCLDCKKRKRCSSVYKCIVTEEEFELYGCSDLAEEERGEKTGIE